MKKGIALSIAAVIVIIGGVILLNYQQAADSEVNANSDPSGPHITIEPSTYDFGRVKFGDVPEYIFVVKNIGDKDLEINSVSTSCACTKGEMEVSSIAPGEQADLVVSFNPAIHGDDTDLGELTRTIYISTNDPHQEEIEAKIYADVFK